MSTFSVEQFDVAKYDAILARGLSHGVGERDGQMCIEAAICAVLELDHDDDPQCVARTVRSFKISLNDRRWSSTAARAKGLRDLGLAQLGSLGVVDDKQFLKLLAEGLIRVMLPTLIRNLWPNDEKLMAAALRCEQEGTRESGLALRDLLRSTYTAAAYTDAAYAADAAAYADDAVVAASAYDAAAYADDAVVAAAVAASAAAAYADAYAAAECDKYLTLAAQIALDVLRKLNSPGCQLLERK